MIESVPGVPDTIKNHVQMIDSEVSRMSGLIQDLLLLSSLDAGNWSLHMDEINIDTLLINLYTKFEPICRKKIYCWSLIYQMNAVRRFILIQTA